MTKLYDLMLRNFRRLLSQHDSQEVLASKMGVSQPVISDYLKGKGWNSVKRLDERLVQAGIDPLELIAVASIPAPGLKKEEREALAAAAQLFSSLPSSMRDGFLHVIANDVAVWERLLAAQDGNRFGGDSPQSDEAVREQ